MEDEQDTGTMNDDEWPRMGIDDELELTPARLTQHARPARLSWQQLVALSLAMGLLAVVCLLAGTVPGMPAAALLVLGVCGMLALAGFWLGLYCLLWRAAP